LRFAASTELGERLRELNERTDVSVLVLIGGVPGNCVAHADLDDLGAPRPRRARRGRSARMAHDAREDRGAAAAVVAAINDQCWGGGWELPWPAPLASPPDRRRSRSQTSPPASSGVDFPRLGRRELVRRLGGCCGEHDLVVDAIREAARLAPSVPGGRFSKSTGESIARHECPRRPWSSTACFPAD